MVLKIINGMRIHEPPYTKTEEDEFYRRVGGGPVTIARPAGDKATDLIEKTDAKNAKSAAIKRDPEPLPDSAIKRGVKRGRCVIEITGTRS